MPKPVVGPGEPTRAEVLSWMVRTGASSKEAALHFWPHDATDAERTRHRNRVAKWAEYSRRAAGVAAPPRRKAPPPNLEILRDDPTPVVPLRSNAPPPPAPVRAVEGASELLEQRPPPMYDEARMGRVDFLEYMLANQLADLEWARRIGQLTQLKQLSALVVETRTTLDEARGEEGRSVKIERTVAGVAAEVERRSRRIAELAARSSG